MNFIESTKHLHKTIEMSNTEWSLKPIQRIIDNLKKENKVRNIQVVGTNGKGTTSFFLQQILLHHDYKVGLFTSPHLIDVRERICVNGEMIAENDFAKYYSKLLTTFEKDDLSYFEKLTLLAYHYFQDQKLDFIIWEAGLGGRLDATTAVGNDILVFTPIAMDHMEYLGYTIDKIVFEKAFVMQYKSQIFSAPQTPSVEKLLKQNATLYQKKIDFVSPVHKYKMNSTGTNFNIKSQTYRINMLGKHYAQNAAVALRVLRKSVTIHPDKVAQALQDKAWSARLEFVETSKYGRFLLSCSHNEQSISKDLQVIKELITQNILQKEIWIVFASTRKRPADLYLKMLASISNNIIITKANSLHPIPEILRPYSEKYNIIENLDDVMTFLHTKPSASKVIMGSIYLCGEILKYR